MKIRHRFLYKPLMIATIFSLFSMALPTSSQASMFSSLFPAYNMMNIYGYTDYEYTGGGRYTLPYRQLYNYNWDVDTDLSTPYGYGRDIYNLGYMNQLAQSRLYNSNDGYPNIWFGLSGLLSIGGF